MPDQNNTRSSNDADIFITIVDAAKQLGIHHWALRRAVNRGEVTGYKAFNGRVRVRLSEVIAVIEASAQGGK